MWRRLSGTTQETGERKLPPLPLLISSARLLRLSCGHIIIISSHLLLSSSLWMSMFSFANIMILSYVIIVFPSFPLIFFSWSPLASSPLRGFSADHIIMCSSYMRRKRRSVRSGGELLYRTIVYTYTHSQVCLYACIRVYLYTCIYAYMCTYMYIHIHIYVYLHSYRHAHIYINMHKCA